MWEKLEKDLIYNKVLFWNTINSGRRMIGITMKDASSIMGFSSVSSFSTYSSNKSDTLMSTACKLCSISGYTVQEAVSQIPIEQTCYYNFVKDLIWNKNLNISKAFLLNEYKLKALLPQFFKAISCCPTPVIPKILKNCLVMPKESLLFLLEKIKQEQEQKINKNTAFINENNLTFENTPDFLTSFWAGVHNRQGMEGMFLYDKQFAEFIGLTANQYLKYMRKIDPEKYNITEETSNYAAEPRISRIVEIANKLGYQLDNFFFGIYEFYYNTPHELRENTDEKLCYKPKINIFFEDYVSLQANSIFKTFPTLTGIMLQLQQLSTQEITEVATLSERLVHI